MNSTDQPTSNPDRLLTIPEAADLLHISERTVYRLIERGELPPLIKIGRASRIRLKEVLAFIARKGHRSTGEAA